MNLNSSYRTLDFVNFGALAWWASPGLLACRWKRCASNLLPRKIYEWPATAAQEWKKLADMTISTRKLSGSPNRSILGLAQPVLGYRQSSCAWLAPLLGPLTTLYLEALPNRDNTKGSRRSISRLPNERRPDGIWGRKWGKLSDLHRTYRRHPTCSDPLCPWIWDGVPRFLLLCHMYRSDNFSSARASPRSLPSQDIVNHRSLID